MNVTRPVIADLWALSAAGEASDDSRRLIEDFLARDPEFSIRSAATPVLCASPSRSSFPPNHEAETLNRTKRRLQQVAVPHSGGSATL